MDEPAPPPTDTFIRIRFTGHEVRPDDDDRCRCRSHSRSPISLCVSPQLTYTDDGSKECVYYQIETEVRCPLFGVAIAVAARSLSCVDDRSLLLLLLLLLLHQCLTFCQLIRMMMCRRHSLLLLLLNGIHW